MDSRTSRLWENRKEKLIQKLCAVPECHKHLFACTSSSQAHVPKQCRRANPPVPDGMALAGELAAELGGEGAASSPGPTGSPIPAAMSSRPVPTLRILTALVSYSTSFWTELMMGAAAVGMAPANGGPTAGHQAATQVVTAAGSPWRQKTPQIHLHTRYR